MTKKNARATRSYVCGLNFVGNASSIWDYFLNLLPSRLLKIRPLTTALFCRGLAKAQIQCQACCSGLRNDNTKIMGFSSATEGGVCSGSLRTPLNQFLAGGET